MPALSGKAVVVTGAGSGLGAAYARLAASEGAAVVVNDIDHVAAEEVTASIVAASGKAVSHVADIADWRGAEGLMARCVAEFGSLDGLVNNAGVEPIGKPWQATEAEIRGTVNTNLIGTLVCGRHALNIMVDQGSGSIVNVTSGAHMGLVNLSVYGATKGAIASVTHCWALDLEETPIRVNAVSPLAATSMAAHNARYAGHVAPEEQAAYLRAFPPPEHNAPLVIYLLSDAARDITGQVVRVDAEAITLVSHPVLLPVRVAADSWTVDAVAEAFASKLSGRMQPLGVKAVGDDGAIRSLRRDL